MSGQPACITGDLDVRPEVVTCLAESVYVADAGHPPGVTHEMRLDELLVQEGHVGWSVFHVLHNGYKTVQRVVGVRRNVSCCPVQWCCHVSSVCLLMSPSQACLRTHFQSSGPILLGVPVF